VAAEADCVLKNKYGLQMRPAEKLVSLASKYTAEVSIIRDTDEVSGKSIISVISLGVGPGTKLKVRCEGPDEKDALAAIVALIEDGFGLDEEK